MDIERHQSKHTNNIVEQDYPATKRIVQPCSDSNHPDPRER